MVTSCSAFGCKNRFVKGGKISFHRFPKDIAKRNKWIIAMKKENWNPTPYSYLCSAHFTNDEFQIRPGKSGQRLCHSAVPSIFAFNSGVRKGAKKRKSKFQRRVIQYERHIIHHKQVQCIRTISTQDVIKHDHAYAQIKVIAKPMKQITIEKLTLNRKVKTLQQKIRRQRKRVKPTLELMEQLRELKLAKRDLTSVNGKL